MVVHDRSVLVFMAAKSSSCNFPEQLSVCAEVIASRFWQNCQQVRDCLNVNALELHMQERFMLTANDRSYVSMRQRDSQMRLTQEQD